MLGAAWIADRALLPAMAAAGNVEAVAIASREPERARAMAAAHGVARVHDDYDALLADADVDAVYIALANSLHRPWTLRALQAGKHVLCEKPLGCTAAEARDMAEAARAAGRVLMEAFMYRFHPRIGELRGRVGEVRHLHAAFSFTLAGGANYRRIAAMGGGALLDVGCYTLDVSRWFCGEPVHVGAVARGAPVDMSVAAAIEFERGATATVWASFEAPEHQELTVVGGAGVERLSQPFTAWRDPHDPYQLMVEAFARSALEGTPPPRPLDESVATAELLDRVREAAALSGSAAP